MTSVETKREPEDLLALVEPLTAATESETAQWSEFGSGYILKWDNFSLLLSRETQYYEDDAWDAVQLELRRASNITIRLESFPVGHEDSAAVEKLLAVVERKVSRIESALGTLQEKLVAGEPFGTSVNFPPTAHDDDIPF